MSGKIRAGVIDKPQTAEDPMRYVKGPMLHSVVIRDS